MAGEIPNQDSEEKGVAYYQRHLDECRGAYLAAADTYANHRRCNPDEFQQTGSELIDAFNDVVESIIDDESIEPCDKSLAFMFLHNEEENKRVEGLNNILGEDIIKADSSIFTPKKFTDLEKYDREYSEDEYEAWIELEVENFKDRMEADATVFLNTVDDKHDTRLKNFMATHGSKFSSYGIITGALISSHFIIKAIEKVAS